MLFKSKVDIDKVKESINDSINEFTNYNEKNSEIKVDDNLNCSGYVESSDVTSKEFSEEELEQLKLEVFTGEINISDSNDLFNQLMKKFGAHDELELSDEFYNAVQHETELSDKQMKKIIQSMLQNVVVVNDKLFEQAKELVDSLNTKISNISQSLIDLDSALENKAYKKIIKNALEANSELTTYSLLEMFLVLWGPWNQEMAKIAASHPGLRDKYNLLDPEAIPMIDPSEFAIDTKEEGVEELISQILEMYPSENIVKVNKQYLALV